jgi:hypothetical protein
MFKLYNLYFVYLQIFGIENYTSLLGIGSFGIRSVISQYTVDRRCVPNKYVATVAHMDGVGCSYIIYRHKLK